MSPTRRRAATLAFTLACVGVFGCESLIGARFDVTEVSCTHAAPPPPPSTQNRPEEPTPMVVAVRAVRLGVANDEFEGFGFDLDGLCTNRSQGPSCATAAWPRTVKNEPFADGTDGEDGRDNGIGRLIKGQTRVFGAEFLTDRTINEAIEAGKGPPLLLFRISGYNGVSVDSNVKVEIFLPAVPSVAVPWSASKVVDVDRRTATRDANGNVVALVVDENAYVNDGVLVARYRPRGDVRPTLRLGEVSFPTEELLVTMRIPTRGQSFDNAEIAGRMKTGDFLRQVGAFTNTGTGGICTDSPLYPNVKAYVCGYADLLADGRIDPRNTCDALGLAMRLELAPATIGDLRDPEPLSGCTPETDPSADDCATATTLRPPPAPPVTDAGADAGTANCVAPGTPNNEEGVGAYCASSVECTTPGTFCTADFGAPPGTFFCSKLCATAGAPCGTGVTCTGNPENPLQVACVPTACVGR